MAAEPAPGPRFWGAFVSQARDAGHIFQGKLLKLPTGGSDAALTAP